MNTIFLRSVCLFCLFLTMSLKGLADQTAENKAFLKFFYKVSDGDVLLRWIPQNPDLWQRGLEEGYVLEKYLIHDESGQAKQLVYKTREPILPMDFASWKGNPDDDQLKLLKELIYIDNNDETWMEDHYPADIYDERKKNRSRFLFSNFIQNSNFEYTVSAGCGYMDIDVNMGETYLYRIYLADDNADNATEILINPGVPSEGPLPQLVCQSGSEQVNFSWNTKDFLDHYYGYTLSWSEDGINFQSMTDAPFFNIYDHMDTVGFFDDFHYKWNWPQKDTTYWFRLRGADYFGGYSEHFSVCSGAGYQPITFSPVITKSTQSDSNYAFIKWKLEQEFETLVEEFQVFRADSMDGIYRPVLTGIPSGHRTISVRMKELTNYYRIVAVPENGPKVSSFPCLVMGIDETPPVAPVNFTASIDSAGIVQFNWNPNKESDLAGYIIYKSYVREADFARINAKPIKQTGFLDSVNMQSGNELVFYKLQAVDKVNNRSAFSEVLKVKKVDVFPPVEPHIHSLKTFEDHIEVKWYPSGSKDVSLHKLFRKNLNGEGGWALLDEYPQESRSNVFKDFQVELGDQYAYTLLAVDDDGLESDFAQIATGKLVDYKLMPSIEDIQLQYVPGGEKVVLTWNYPIGKSCEMAVYKGETLNRSSILATIDLEQARFEDHNVRKDHSYVYLLKAECEDGTTTPFSEKLEIIIPK